MDFYLNKTTKMHKQKVIYLLILWIFILSLTGCEKNTSNNIDNNITIWSNDTTIWEDNEQELGVNNDIEYTEEDVEKETIEEEVVEEEVKDEEEPEKIDWTFKYDSKLYNYTIQIPNNWNFVENEYGFSVLVYTPEDWNVRENLWITIQTPQIDTNLEEYYKESMQKIAEISEWFKEIKTSDIEVNWLKGKNTIYETVQNDTNIKSQQTVFIDSKNYIYILQYTATKETFDKYIDGVSTIIKSFKILN